MPHSTPRPAFGPATLLGLCLVPGLATPAAADDLLSSNKSIINNNLCVGGACDAASGESYNGLFQTLRIKAQNTRIEFVDTSTDPSFSTQDWAIDANDTTSGGLGRLKFEDTDGGTVPVSIVAEAPENSLFVASSGHIGVGTSLPEAPLHVLRNDSPRILLEQTAESFPAAAWSIIANEDGIRFSDAGFTTSPFFLRPGVPNGGILIEPTVLQVNAFKLDYDFEVWSHSGQAMIFTDASANRVGLGTETPAASPHLRRADGTSQLRVEETSTTVSPRTLLNLQNNGRPEIVMGNTSTGGEWSFGAGTNFILKQGGVGSASNAKTKLFEVTAAGDATLTGTLVTGGTTCGTGCDAVFAPDYPLPSIADHAAQMQALGYLPNVGPTLENTPINVTDKLGRMLNELEHAHLYIAQLEARDRDKTGRLDAQDRALADQRALIVALTARLDRVETRQP